MQNLIETVQHNCDIADARHGSDYGMCTYLLKMRELYRWERGLPLGVPLGRDEVGNWLTAREQHLERIEAEEYRSIEIGEQAYDPFDAEGINAAVVEEGLVYSAGLVQAARPHFFLAELLGEESADNGFRLRVSGRELARCLSAPPAMTRGTTIFLRRESLRRYLWEKYESWLWSRPQNAMARAIAHYPFERELDRALDEMTTAEMAVIEAHERGEYQAGLELGENWEAMLFDLRLTPAEIMARAVRDHLADCTHTLPLLVEQGRDASLHFFMANLGAMRKALFPGLQVAYRHWLDHDDRSFFVELAEQGTEHWRSLAQKMIALHKVDAAKAADGIVERVNAAHL